MALTETSDPTFRAYNNGQAKKYYEGRPSYAPELYQTILRHHDATGGRRGVVVDVGCGPGRATRDLARFFDRAIGLDPGSKMIETARHIGGVTQTGRDIEYHTAAAETIAELEQLPTCQVDLLTAAAAVHWFDMPAFWAQAARLVRPGGTVALWTTGCFYCHPTSPSAAGVNRTMRRLEDVDLASYELPPNILSRTLYDGLALPWDLNPPNPAFLKSDYVRQEWDRDGVLSNGVAFFGGSMDIPLSLLEKGYDTASTVTRWREANPELAHGPRDCVRMTIEQIRADIGPGAGDVIHGSTSTVLLLFKRQ